MGSTSLKRSRWVATSLELGGVREPMRRESDERLPVPRRELIELSADVIGSVSTGRGLFET